MTSASELFHNRRSRFGRNSDLFDISGLDSSSDRAGNRRHRIPGGGGHTRLHDGCDPVRRAIHGHRQTPNPHRPHPFQEREPILFESGGHHHSPAGNVRESGNQTNERDRLRLSGNDRLPRAVVLARERLLQRLSSVSLSGARRNNRSSSSSHRNDTTLADDFRLVDAGDWDTEISLELPASIVLLTNSIGQPTSKRPPGLTQEAINQLPKVVFEPNMSKMSKECSICLETFLDGDELIDLQCGHKYHVSCLVPWVSTCADCPYCRRGINITSGEQNPGI